jgi:hypothetical protein
MPIAPSAAADIGKILLEVGKALGKAVIAGVGLELARVASGHVKKAVGPKDDKAPSKDAAQDASKDATTSAPATAPAPATADDIDRIRRENAQLREELESLKRELRKVPVDSER